MAVLQGYDSDGTHGRLTTEEPENTLNRVNPQILVSQSNHIVIVMMHSANLLKLEYRAHLVTMVTFRLMERVRPSISLLTFLEVKASRILTRV